MKCKTCSKKAVYNNPSFCRDHFIRYVEKTIKDTVQKYDMIKGRPFVAVSGGKDSLTCLYNLRERKPVALAIDEGIKGYREHTLKDLKKFCKEHDIELHVISFKDEYKTTLDDYLKKHKEKPCTVCGAIRRMLINKHARRLGARRIATGHNLDDEAQSVMMNFFRNQLDVSARLGPVTGVIKDKRFIPRVKPLYFLSEKEITAYSLLKGFDVRYVECPYSIESYRNRVQEILNQYEAEHPGSKKNIIKSFLKMLPELKEKHRGKGLPNACKECGEPAKSDLCKVCQLLKAHPEKV